MRAFEDTQTLTSPKLAWLVALLAAAAVMLAPATAFGEEAAVACDPEAEECVTATAVVTETETTVGVSEEPVVSEEPPPVGEETPVVGEPVPGELPTPRIEPVPPVEVTPVEEAPVVTLEAPADVPPVVNAEPPVAAPDPAAPVAPDTPDAAAAPFTAAAVPDEPVAAPKPDLVPSVPSVPDYAKNVLADAPPAALVDEVAPAAKKLAAIAKPKVGIEALQGVTTGASRFGNNALVAAPEKTESAIAALATKSPEEIFGAAAESIRPAVAEPRNLLEVLATYLVPGEGGSYTATLAALLQLAFVLVIWGLLRPRPVSSSIAELRSSRAVGYRAVVFRPG